jgi:hypothetical protein
MTCWSSGEVRQDAIAAKTAVKGLSVCLVEKASGNQRAHPLCRRYRKKDALQFIDRTQSISAEWRGKKSWLRWFLMKLESGSLATK